MAITGTSAAVVSTVNFFRFEGRNRLAGGINESATGSGGKVLVVVVMVVVALSGSLLSLVGVPLDLDLLRFVEDSEGDCDGILVLRHNDVVVRCQSDSCNSIVHVC